MDNLFPTIKKNIEMLIEDEEGNIPGNKLLVLGTMVVILGTLISIDAFAAHRSHSSHRSHRSHSSGSGGHYSHVSHQSHTSSTEHSNHSSHSDHGSHLSHTSHANDASHSNSRYSAEGDVSYAPEAASIQGITTPAISNTEEVFKLPEVNQNIEIPKGTPGSGIVPYPAVPASTLGTNMTLGGLNDPSFTEPVE